MSRERKFEQRLVNGLFWTRLSNLITILDCLETSATSAVAKFRADPLWA